jgi:hypothetical protein
MMYSQILMLIPTIFISTCSMERRGGGGRGEGEGRGGGGVWGGWGGGGGNAGGGGGVGGRGGAGSEEGARLPAAGRPGRARGPPGRYVAEPASGAGPSQPRTASRSSSRGAEGCATCQSGLPFLGPLLLDFPLSSPAAAAKGGGKLAYEPCEPTVLGCLNNTQNCNIPHTKPQGEL